MPEVSAEEWVPVPPAIAFAVSQTTGPARLRWDPFVRNLHLIGADGPGAGVRTFTRSRLGPSMTSRYVSYLPPASVGVTMESGPWYLGSFGGGWRFTPETRDGVAGTYAVWTYTWASRPRLLSPFADPLGRRLLRREIQSRITAFAWACSDPDVLGAI